MPKVFKLQQLGAAIQQILNAVRGKAEQSDLNAHTDNGDVHVSTTEKSRWNDTYTKTQVDERIEQGGKVKTVSVNGGDAVQPDEHGNIDIEVPTDLKDLNDDATHRTVTDEEKAAWSGKQPAGDYATRTELAWGLATKQPAGDYATNLALTEGLAGKQGTISDLDAIRSGAGKGATSLQGVKMEGDDEPLSPDGNGVVTIPQPEIPDSVTSVIANNELVLQTPDGQSVKGKVGITTGADGLLHLTLTDEEGHTYSSPIAGLRVVGNALQYSNDGETWTTVQTFGKLAIKYAQASDPASGDEGDLALVGSTNAYVLKVYVGGSWVSVCDFGTLDLTSDGITMAGENKTLTEKLVNYSKMEGAFMKDTIVSGDKLPDGASFSYETSYLRVNTDSAFTEDTVIKKIKFDKVTLDRATTRIDATLKVCVVDSSFAIKGDPHEYTLAADAYEIDVDIEVLAGEYIGIGGVKIGTYEENGVTKDAYLQLQYNPSQDGTNSHWCYASSIKKGGKLSNMNKFRVYNAFYCVSQFSGVMPKSADELVYDNTNSGLESENLQGAIDELNEKVNEIEPDVVAGNVGYDNSQSMLESETVQGALDEVAANTQIEDKIIEVEPGDILTLAKKSAYIDYRFQYDSRTPVSKIIFSKNHLDRVVDRQDFVGKVFACDSNRVVLDIKEFTLPSTSYEIDCNLVVPSGGFLGFLNSVVGTDSLGNEVCLLPTVKGVTSTVYGYSCLAVSLSVGATLNTALTNNYLSGYSVFTNREISEIAKDNKKQVDVLRTMLGENSVGVADATTCLMLGSSLTDDVYTPLGLGWCDRLNDLVDVNVLNGGWSGTALLANIRAMMSELINHDYTNSAAYRKIPYKIDYLWWGNTANHTPAGKEGILQLLEAKKVSEMFGAKMLVGTEHTAVTTVSAQAYDMSRREFGFKHNVPVSAITVIGGKLRGVAVNPNADPTKPYNGFSDGGTHDGYRAAGFFTIHRELLSRIEVRKNVKLFKVRPDYQGGSPTVAQLAYDGNEERFKYFTAIVAGSGGRNGGTNYVGVGRADNVDNDDYSVGDALGSALVQEEFELLKGNAITFNKYCLVEFILDRIHITKTTFSAEVSVEPTAVYISTKKSAYDNGCSEWVELTDKIYQNGVLTAHVEKMEHEIESFDKVKILLYYADGDFTLNKPTLRDYDGIAKVPNDLLNGYHHRQYGAELNAKTSCEEGWTLSNAEVKSLPTEIANYSRYNDVKSHVELLTDEGTMVKSVNVGTAKKVAVRVVANLFPKIATTRTFQNMTAEQLAEYISSDAPTVVERGYNFGTLTLGVNDAVYEEFLMQPGWMEYYTEIELTDETELTITIGRKNAVDGFTTNSGFKVLVHDVSVQAIG